MTYWRVGVKIPNSPSHIVPFGVWLDMLNAMQDWIDDNKTAEVVNEADEWFYFLSIEDAERFKREFKL